ARRAPPPQPAPHDEAAGQPVLRADGPAGDPAHRHAARRRRAPHVRGRGVLAPGAGGRGRRGGRARRPLRRLRAAVALSPPIGVVLAGGGGRRLGGAGKAGVELAGRPLLAWVLEALTGALDEVAVAAQPSTSLPGSSDGAA